MIKTENKPAKKRGDIIYRTINGQTKQYKILFSKRQVKLGVRKIARNIYNYCKENNIKQIVFVAIAIGGINVMADLERAMYYEADTQKKKNGKRYNIEIKTTIIAMKKNYQGDQMVNCQRILTHAPVVDLIENRQVFIIDNLLATGLSMQAAIEKIKSMNPKNIYSVVFLDTKNTSDLIPDFTGIRYKKREVFLYGYGLDNKDAVRGDKYIYEDL